MSKFFFCDRRLRPEERYHVVYRTSFKGAQLKGRGAEVCPLQQCGPWHDESLSTRRGVRHGRRRGDRSRALRTLYRRGPQPVFQPHDGQVYWNVLNRNAAARPCRSSRMLRTKSRISSTMSAVNRTPDVVITGNRGHDGRYRANPQAIRQVSLEQGARQQPVYSRHACAVSQKLRRAQVEADAAFRPGIAVNGDFPGYHRHALRRAGG